MKITDTVNAEAWVSQFVERDQLVAKYFLNRLLLISASEFESGMAEIILSKSESLDGKIALLPLKRVRKAYDGKVTRERYDSSGK